MLAALALTLVSLSAAQPMPLLRRLEGGSPASRREAAASLGAEGQFTAVPPLGAALLRVGEDDGVKVAAALALGRVANWRAEFYLAEALKDPSPEVRTASCLSLGRSRGPQAQGALLKVLLGDREPRVRQAAALALGGSSAPGILAALAASARSDASLEVRLQAVRSLGQAGSRDAGQALAGALADPSPVVRAAAATALGHIGGLGSLDLLTKALDSESSEPVRLALAEAATRILLPRPQP